MLTITLPSNQNNGTELTLVTYTNYTGSFESVVVNVSDARACERFSAQPQYGAISFSVLITTDDSSCKSRSNSLSTLAIVGICVGAVVLVVVLTVILVVLFVFPQLLRRKVRPRTRMSSIVTH